MAPLTRSQRQPMRDRVAMYMEEQRRQRIAAAEMEEAANALLALAKKEKNKAEKNLKAARAARDKILRKERVEREKALPVRQTRSMARR